MKARNGLNIAATTDLPCHEFSRTKLYLEKMIDEVQSLSIAFFAIKKIVWERT